MREGWIERSIEGEPVLTGYMTRNMEVALIHAVERDGVIYPITGGGANFMYALKRGVDYFACQNEADDAVRESIKSRVDELRYEMERLVRRYDPIVHADRTRESDLRACHTPAQPGAATRSQ